MSGETWPPDSVKAALAGKDSLDGIAAAFLCLGRVMMLAGIPLDDLVDLLMQADESVTEDMRGA